jgi:hypothetical protein
MKLRKNGPIWRRKSAISSRKCTVSQINQNDGNKLHELGDELLPHPPYSPDLALSDLFLFADLKKMLVGKKFSIDEEVITETVEIVL